MASSTGVSVVVPVYNAEAYIKRCVESVIKQTHQNLEMILVDDGSTDGGSAVCKEYTQCDPRIKYVRQENAGTSAAKNMGIKMSTFDFITFLDADDWFEETFIEKIIGAMLDKNIDIGICDIYYVNSSDMSRRLVKIRFDKNVVSAKSDKSVINKSRLFVWGKIYKKSLFMDSNIEYLSFSYEDTITPALVAAADQVAYVSEPLINYFRNRPDSLSNDRNNITDIEKGLRLLRGKFEEMGLYDEYALEFKKIALGQLRFACRKWGLLSDKGVLQSLRELEDYVGVVFPELCGISQKRYFAFGEKSLERALDKALPYAKQLVADVASANAVVAFDSDAGHISEMAALLIKIPSLSHSQRKGTTEEEYNIAELIMERLR